MDKLGGRTWVDDTPGGGATLDLQFRTGQAKAIGRSPEPGDGASGEAPQDGSIGRGAGLSPVA